MTKKSLSILLVEDSRNYIEKEVGAIRDLFQKYLVEIYTASNVRELSGKLQEGHYDLAFVDFDCEGNSWMTDAIDSAYKISQSQPDCLRIGFSGKMVINTLEFSNAFSSMIKEVYPIITTREEIMDEDKRKSLKEKLANFRYL
jgi:hypothetical protein